MSPEQAETSAPTDAAASDAVTPVAPVVVVRGAATAEEVAVLVAVLAAASGDGDGSAPGAAQSSQSGWAAHGATLRRPVGHGPGAWRSSLRS